MVAHGEYDRDNDKQKTPSLGWGDVAARERARWLVQGIFDNGVGEALVGHVKDEEVGPDNKED